MPEIDKSYSTEVDTADRDIWYKIISNFSDANILSKLGHMIKIRFGKEKMSHLILKKDGKIAAPRRCEFVKIPIINVGMAYVFWGPLLKIKNIETDPHIFFTRPSGH